jgi:competence protein ComFA
MGAFSFVCPICGNSDRNSIGIRNGKFYCRKCISFRGQEVFQTEQSEKPVIWDLNYELSEDQKELGEELLKNFIKHKNSFVYAVCGSGKTEITLRLISYAISKGKNVGFAVPRRDVVIELGERFKQIFKENTIVEVYGGHTTTVKGDLICCTTHQLFRYPGYFDLLILDEIDAFPFHENEVLNAFSRRSVKGNFVMMSATPSQEQLHNFEKDGGIILQLFTRYHRYPLPVPRVIIVSKSMQKLACYRLIKNLTQKGKPVFVFTPTIRLCEELFGSLKYFLPHGNYVHSKRENRQQIIQQFREGKYKYLITTSVLERGVTMKGLQVVVFQANHSIYNSYALIQIAGRVGRKKEDPEGNVIFLSNETNQEINRCIRTIEWSNKNLQNLFKTDT